MRRALKNALRVAVVALAVASARDHAAAQEERPEVIKALDLEAVGKYRDAAVLFRRLVKTGPNASVVLGLERVYAELGMSDSLLAPLDTLIAANPREPLYRTVQLRTLQMLRKDDTLREAFERWVRATPRDATPYREYARVLIALGRPATADSIVGRGKTALGSLRDLELENAQLRAAMGDWLASAESFRRALPDAPYLAAAATHALAPTPVAIRDAVRAALATLPADPGARQALANLELSWGRPRDAWDAIRVLRPDTAAASIWEQFGEEAYSEERWALAREAFVAALSTGRTSALAMRAAAASLKAGVPAEVFTLLPLAGWGADSAQIARQYIPVHVAALVALNRAPEAERLVERYAHFLAPIQRMRVAQSIATAWIRTGDIPKARESLRAAGPDADSSEAAGWLALYEGRIGSARNLLRTSSTATPELTLAMGIIARFKGDDAITLGAGFLALARGDTAGAALHFVETGATHPEVAPALLLTSARLLALTPDKATRLWERIITEYASSPEAVDAELEWARYLRRNGKGGEAVTHLEHLILSAPQSALLPQARRELEQLHGGVPQET